jgi:ATP-dependent DNA helicase RecG
VVGDLLYVLPRTWEDRRGARSIASLEPGETAVVSGEVVASGQIGGGGRGRGRGRGSRWEVVLDDGTGRLKLTFFRFSAWDMKKRYERGQVVTASGEVAVYKGMLQMVHPRVAAGARTDELSGVFPVYPEVGGMHPLELARNVSAALDYVRAHPPRDLLPEHIRDAADVPGLLESLEAVHAPDEDISPDELADLISHDAPAFRRLAFEELFVLQIAMALRRRAGLVEPAPALPGDDVPTLARRALPYTLTGAQARTANEIFADLDRDEPMARLLQGDVGAGKTAVAALASLRCVRAGYQAAFMAPTEILAEQHRLTLESLLAPLFVRVGFLSGSLKTKERREVTEALADGEIDVLVGTHALLSDDVDFHKLGFCVIDEQHRFGVVQRAALREKGPRDDARGHLVPHLLVMTATPIPRSLALTYYGDLQVSVIDEMPPGRTPVKTRVVDDRLADRVWEAVGAALERGERAYVVYPLIEESEKLDLQDATQGFEQLKERFGEEHVALLHGRMASDERDRVMTAFKKGDVSVLVSTTVIEVGVDVPEASCMVVVGSERFGLSQLHQLRGRVGRGAAKSECWLIATSGGEDAARRLRVMEETTDGFRIAEEDLAIRGPGDFLGTRQSGLPTLLFSDFAKHAELIELARHLATKLCDEDPDLGSETHKPLLRLVQTRFKDRLALTGAG